MKIQRNQVVKTAKQINHDTHTDVFTLVRQENRKIHILSFTVKLW